MLADLLGPGLRVVIVGTIAAAAGLRRVVADGRVPLPLRTALWRDLADFLDSL